MDNIENFEHSNNLEATEIKSAPQQIHLFIET